jgi:multicomponent Na+:H+ antiporter subunit D
MSHAPQLLAALGVPILGALLIWASAARPMLREAVSLTTAAALFGLVVSLVPPVMAGDVPQVSLFDIVPGLPIAFALEPLGMLFALIASFLWIATTVYAIGYVRANNEGHQTRFYVCFAIALASAIGVAFAANMFTLFLFYEVLTLSTYPLVTHSGTAEARRSGRIYLGLLLTTSILFQLFAILWTWVEVGTLDFRAGGILDGQISGATAAVLLVLYMFGVGKAALMPLHGWLPAAMVAPTPVSALLHAVAVVKAGVFTVLKILVYIFGLDFLRAMTGSEWLIAVACFTIVIASVIALRQDNLKRRLAYSTISQLAYVVLGGALATSAGLMGGAMHIATHAFGKITLFFCAGAIYTAAHKTLVSELDGIGHRMPLTMAAFTIGAFSLIGLPPLAALWSKWYLVIGADSGHYLWVIAVLLGSSLLNALYFLPILARAFFPMREGQPPAIAVARKEAPWPMLVAISVTALGTVVLFFYPQFVFDLIQPMLENQAFGSDH